MIDMATAAFWLSVLAIVIASVSAWYTRKQANIAAKQAKRKAPTLEIRSSSQAVYYELSSSTHVPPKAHDMPGIHCVNLLVRNIEPSCSARLIGIEVKSSQLGALERDLGETDIYGNTYMTRRLDRKDLSKFIVLDQVIDAQKPDGTASLRRYTLYTSEPGNPKQFRLKWQWLDGQKP